MNIFIQNFLCNHIYTEYREIEVYFIHEDKPYNIIKHYKVCEKCGKKKKLKMI